MSVFDFAKVGLRTHARSAAATGQVGPIPPSAKQPAVRNAASAPHVGWTTPATTYEKMRMVDGAARELDTLIQVNVKRPAFKASWDAWYASWRKFFDESMTTFNKLGALFRSDEIAERAENFRAQLFNIPGGWRDGYSRERDDKGDPLPTPVTPPVEKPANPNIDPGKQDKEEGFTVPWWGWMLGGIAVVGVGYYVYRRYKSTSDMLAAREHALTHRVLPAVLGSQMGPTGVEFAHAAAAGRDATLPGLAPQPSPGYLPPHYRSLYPGGYGY